MTVKYAVGQDAQSQAALRSAMSGDERTPIPREVESGSGVPAAVDGGTAIPAKVDDAGVTR